MKIADSAVSDAIRMISTERFREFRENSPSDLWGITMHQHSVAVCGSVMPLIALTEIALRNCVNEAISGHFNNDDWLLTLPPGFVFKADDPNRIKKAVRDAQRTMYAKLSNREKVALDQLAYPNGIPLNLSPDKRVKARQGVISPTQGKVIAQLTIYFWKRLFSPDYDATLWRPVLKRLFPSKSITRGTVANHLEKIYAVRNRVAHHEVILPRHLTGVAEAFMFISGNLKPLNSTCEDALHQMVDPHAEGLVETLKAMNAMVDEIRAEIEKARAG